MTYIRTWLATLLVCLARRMASIIVRDTTTIW